MSRDEIVITVLRCLRSICTTKGIAESPSFTESTPIIGSDDAVLDSLGAVMLLVQVEENLNRAIGRDSLLVQKLMMENFDRGTVGTLADRAMTIIGDRP